MTEDKAQLAFNKLMDSVFDLAEFLCEVDSDDLVPHESRFLESLDLYCEAVEEEEDE